MNWNFLSLRHLLRSEVGAIYLGLVALSAGLVLTLWTWRLAVDYELSQQLADLNHDATQIAVAVTERLAQYQTVERSGQALFVVSPSVQREQWRVYVKNLQVKENFPGLVGLAFISYVPHQELTRFLARSQADGAPDFVIHPGGRRDAYCIIQYIEPAAGNDNALGFDSCTLPASRRAMEQARDTGRPILTDWVQLSQQPDNRSAVVLYAPVYHAGAPVQTVEERRAALRGWIGARIRIDILMQGVIPKGSTVDLDIFAGNKASLNTLLYNHDGKLDTLNGHLESVAEHSNRLLFPTTIEFGGQIWMLRFSRQISSPYGETALVVISGTLISLLLFVVLWSLGRTKAKAQALAEKMTAALRDSENAIRTLYEVTTTDHRSTEAKIQSLLTMGCQRFGLDTGILSHVEGQRYEVVAVVSPDGEIGKGNVYELADTYCEFTLKNNAPLCLEKVWGTALQHHPGHARFGLQAYLGTTVMVRGQPYGTLNFYSRHPRSAPFTLLDREILQLMVQWIGGVIEREQMEEEARQHQAMLTHATRLNTMGEMASGLAHELNQPLTCIVNFAEACTNMLRAGRAEREESLAILEKISAQSQRAGKIIHRMRRFIRKGEVQRAVVEITAIIDEIREFIAIEARRYAITIHYQLKPDLPPLLVDRIQIQQVILNLIRNAMEAIRGQDGVREITIQASCYTDTLAEIAIRDTGPGLSTEIASRILDPFFTTKTNGLGLGLTISQSIVETHGGSLWVSSHTGPGATFHFTLPIAGAVYHDN